MLLRPYQKECVSQVEKAWRTFERILAILPTGAGKTIIFCFLVSILPGRKLIIAHREELLTQALDKLKRTTGIIGQLEKGSDKAECDAQVVIGSIQTLANRFMSMNPNRFDYIIVDEAHHVLAEGYMKVLSHFKAKVLGVTATPDRGDKKNLGEYFEEIAYERTLVEMIKEGFLCPIKVKQIPLDIQLDKLRVSMGDYSLTSCGDTLTPYLQQIAEKIVTHAEGRKTLIFLPLIKTSETMQDILADMGIKSAHIDGKSPDRKEILDGFASGKHEILCNSMLLTEGYDEPSIECIVNLRPTKNRALYSQIVGRGTRLHEGKEDLLILDFLFQSGSLPLVHPYDLITDSPEVVAEIEKDGEVEGDLLEIVERGVADREESLKKKLKAASRRKARTVSAIDFALQVHDRTIYDYQPVMQWEKSYPSEKQLELLERFGFGKNEIYCKGLASKILDRVMSRRKLNLATPKQLAMLKRNNVDGAEQLTFEEAKLVIEGIMKKWN